MMQDSITKQPTQDLYRKTVFPKMVVETSIFRKDGF